MPAAAITPAWRMPPPSIFRARRALSINPRLPVTTDPTGAPSPLERQNVTESACAATSFAGTPIATHALKSRAPSRWTASPCSCRDPADLLERLERVDRPAAPVVGGFQADERVSRIVDVGRPDGIADVGGVEDAVAPAKRPRLHGREDRQGGDLVVEDVAVLVQDDLVPSLRVRHEGDLIPLRPGRHEQGRLFPQALGGQGLQAQDGGVLHEHVVADLRFGHGPPHLGGRRRHRVAAEVHHSIGVRRHHDSLLLVP